MPRGLIGEPFSPLPGCIAFYFRVSFAGRPSFDLVIGSHKTLASASDAVRKLYPGATLTALKETVFDMDGLPRVNVREHKEKDET